ncbi:MAG TPA: DUF2090 domain-containing protein [Candidatus Angelobacter sp.]
MTRSLGFDKPLYVLSFDYRGPLLSAFGSEGMHSSWQTAEVASTISEVVLSKHFVYDGFEAALASGVPKDKAAILVDERFGDDILRHAAERGCLTACPVEKTGQEEFEFEYGENFAKHIEDFSPTFCRAQVSYDPEASQDLNRRQSSRLRRLSEYLHDKSRSLLMLELLVRAQNARPERVTMEKEAYDPEDRAAMVAEAIRQLQDAAVEPDIWSIEALDRGGDYEKVVRAARRGGRGRVGCLVLGEGEDDEKVRESLATAAAVPGFVGFAAGRKIFWGPLSGWLARQLTPKAATADIGHRFREFVNIFEKGRYKMVA